MVGHTAAENSTSNTNFQQPNDGLGPLPKGWGLFVFFLVIVKKSQRLKSFMRVVTLQVSVAASVETLPIFKSRRETCGSERPRVLREPQYENYAMGRPSYAGVSLRPGVQAFDLLSA